MERRPEILRKQMIITLFQEDYTCEAIAIAFGMTEDDVASIVTGFYAKKNTKAES